MGQISETDYGFKLINSTKSKFISKRLDTSNNDLKMSTFSLDNSLPSLPVPDLEKTLKKYLDSVRPFVNDLEYLQTKKIVENFQYGIGKTLHFHLLERAKNERNWLEQWWLDWAYLEWREPIAPYINTTGFVVGSELPKNLIDKCNNLNVDIQCSSAAFSIYFYNLFFEELRNETFPIQKSRSNYFSMDQFRKFYNSCRIPLKNKDRLDSHFRTVNEGSCPTHFILIYKNRFFKIDAYHPDNQLLNISEIYHQLKRIKDQFGSKSQGIGIGALTADKRDSWADNIQYLIELDPKNSKNFEIIEKALYLVNFDDDIANNIDEMIALGLLKNPKNRYFDKSYQLIVSKNGILGSNIEHTPFDGMVSTTITSYSLDKIKKLNMDFSMVNGFEKRPNLEEPIELEFLYDLKIENEIRKSTNLFESFCAGVECKNVTFSTCDKEKLKSYKINPDTFTQMCMQLAYYQLHNKPAPTYETATTRGYYHGRTETVRSCTAEAIEWCKEMCNKDKSTRLNDSELLKLFKRACGKHDSLMNEARENSGCDRHLLGLMLISKSLNLDLPDIYTDPSWKKSGGGGNFLISSSCVGYTNVLGTCCPFCLNGYTIIYCFSNQGLSFGITRYRASTETNIQKMSDSLQSAILQLQKLFELNSKI